MNTDHMLPTLGERYTANALSLDIAGIMAARGSVDHTRMTTMAVLYPIASVMVGFSVYRACTEFMGFDTLYSIGISFMTMLGLTLIDRAALTELIFNGGKSLKWLMLTTRIGVFIVLFLIGLLSGASRFADDVNSQKDVNIKTTLEELLSKDQTTQSALKEKESLQTALDNKRQQLDEMAKNIKSIDQQIQYTTRQHVDELGGKIADHRRGPGDISKKLEQSLVSSGAQRNNIVSSYNSLNQEVSKIQSALTENLDLLKSQEAKLKEQAKLQNSGTLDRLDIALSKAGSSFGNIITFALFVFLSLTTELLMMFIYCVYKGQDSEENESFRTLMHQINHAHALTQRIAQRESFSASLKPLIVRAKPLVQKQEE